MQVEHVGRRIGRPDSRAYSVQLPFHGFKVRVNCKEELHVGVQRELSFRAHVKGQSTRNLDGGDFAELWSVPGVVPPNNQLVLL